MAVATYQLCFFTGTARTGVALATVVALGSAPVLSGLAVAASTGRLPTTRWTIGTATAIVGVILIARTQPGRRTDLVGVVAALAAGAGWATYAAIGRQRIRAGLDSTTCMAALFSGGAVLSLPLLGMGGIAWVAAPRCAALSLYLGVVTIGVVYASFGRGLRTLSAPMVVTLTLAEPMTAAVLATTVLGQTIGFGGWTGVLLVLGALLLTASGAAET